MLYFCDCAGLQDTILTWVPLLESLTYADLNKLKLKFGVRGRDLTSPSHVANRHICDHDRSRRVQGFI